MRHGTIVLDGAHATASADGLTSAADPLAMVARQLGLDPAKAHHALDEAFRRI
ncbi:hypothetical protein GALL_291790 [mine drainage metagenome]|uniref:Uncharacterized protein n=1 Tax=mine drainage metagenome TaxID=410659 RepID=A0A1J5RA05_9ZZZZ